MITKRFRNRLGGRSSRKVGMEEGSESNELKGGENLKKNTKHKRVTRI